MAATPAMIGDATAGTSTLDTMPATLTADGPAETSVAPTTPPISACDELDGRPKYQVARFHTIAPSSPANTVVVLIAPASTIPLAMVVATASERKAPRTFRTAES